MTHINKLNPTFHSDECYVPTKCPEVFRDIPRNLLPHIRDSLSEQAPDPWVIYAPTLAVSHQVLFIIRFLAVNTRQIIGDPEDVVLVSPWQEFTFVHEYWTALSIHTAFFMKSNGTDLCSLL